VIVTVWGREMLRDNTVDLQERENFVRSHNFYSVKNSMSAWEVFLTYRLDDDDDDKN